MKPLLRLFPFIRPYFGFLVTSVLLAIPLAALRTAPVPLVQHFVNDLSNESGRQNLLLYPLLIIGLYLLNFVVRFFHFFCMRIVVSRVNRNIKNSLFDHLIHLSADHFTSKKTGALLSRVNEDTNTLNQALYGMNALIREPFNFLALLGYALYLNWKLTLLTFVIFPPLSWIFKQFGKNLKRYIVKIADAHADLFSVLQESFAGFRMLQLYGLEKYVGSKFRETNERFYKFLMKTAVNEETSHPLVELVGAIAIALVIFVGGQQVMAGKMQPGDLLAFFAAFGLMMNPIRLMNDMNMKMHQAAGAAGRVFELFDWKTNIIEPENAVRVAGFHEVIQFDNVTFSYPDEPERNVLQSVSFSVPKGKSVALVGPSGAGKSSIIQLLPRIFDPKSGRILIDGKDIKNLELAELRKLIAVVSQDVFLFNDTVETNIRCGNLEASEDQIREAARKANATEFIERMPQGFKTIIGERGQKLSGGERQRLAIARAFLRESPILILDEATSSLDNASERSVQKALDELSLNRTTIQIAHRLSTIRNADEILVIQSGVIVERGNHDSLLSNKGSYAELHRLGATEAL